MKTVIEIKEVKKIYRNSSTPALNGISFKVKESEILGFLGPNGAGKTTLISIITGLVKADSGYVTIFGKPIESSTNAVRKQIGLVPQEIALYPSLSSFENLFFFGQMYGLPTQILKDRIKEWLLILDLESHKSKQVGQLSGGMKRRLNLIVALLHNPEIIILDEPTVGVDVHSKAIILDQLKKLKAQGKTLIYTSHQLEEAEHICDTILIMDKGKVITEGTSTELLNKESGYKSLEQIFIKATSKG